MQLNLKLPVQPALDISSMQTPQAHSLHGPRQVECEASVLASFGGQDVDRLPSASTCYNMLKLPNYRQGFTVEGRGSGLAFWRHLPPPAHLNMVLCSDLVRVTLSHHFTPASNHVSRLCTHKSCRRSSTLREKLLYAVSSGAGFELS